MQKLIYGRVAKGISEKGKAYDLTEVSNGFSSFTLSNGEGISDLLTNELKLEMGDEFMAEVHVDTQFGSLRGTIIRAAEIT